MDSRAKRLLEMIQMLESSPQSHISNIIRDFEENNIEYCIIGAISMARHNYIRQTEDIDLLISKEGFKKIKSKLVGKGYSLRPGSTKNLYYHSATTKFPIDVIIEGDNKNGFIAPNPSEVRERRESGWYLSLPDLIAFKLRASKNPSRQGRDIQDVKMLIKNNFLSDSYVNKLPDDVKSEYKKLFSGEHSE